MKFLRLRIANYRGVSSAEVRFSPLGITLVQGPNEAGKTSLGEAIGLLFEYPDNSKHRAVDAVRPVHRDEGAEIEREAESDRRTPYGDAGIESEGLARSLLKAIEILPGADGIGYQAIKDGIHILAPDVRTEYGYAHGRCILIRRRAAAEFVYFL